MSIGSGIAIAGIWFGTGLAAMHGVVMAGNTPIAYCAVVATVAIGFFSVLAD